LVLVVLAYHQQLRTQIQVQVVRLHLLLVRQMVVVVALLVRQV
jgi:hypothetical protein